MALLTLFVLPRFEKHIQTDWYSTITVALTLDALSEQELRKRIETLGLIVKSIKLTYELDKKERTIIYEVKLRKAEVFETSNKAVAELAKCPGILRVRWI